MPASPLRSAVLGLLVAGAALGFLRSLEDALAGYDARRARTGPPLVWHFGMAPVAALERCVAAARPHLPPGSVVAFAGPPEPRGDGFLRWRWAAYFLPERDVVRWRGAAGPGPATHVLACRRDLAGDSRLAAVARLPAGRLYRVR
ncbi:MAG TPA: hypothetical protein VF121_19860 [Thermoanaerobaculia bacterium]|nr:hypothetical protein [Thermoanaerobaculia bacterium]